MASELQAVSASGTVYAIIINSAGLWYNTATSAFEAYNASNYTSYDVAMTEEGDSAVYVADFPSAITAGGTYRYFAKRQAGGSPAEADTTISHGAVDWTGTVAVTSVAGSMTGSDWRDYVLRGGFKRTDKDTELYEATTDVIKDLRRDFMFDEAKAEATTTDTISVLGDFKINVESDLGLILGIVLEDDDTGTPLVQKTKAQFDQIYPSINVDTDKGYPRHFTIYAGSIYIGPIPDQTSYSYRISYSKLGGTITSSTTGVPFTAAYRDMLRLGVLAELFEQLEEFDRAQYYLARFEQKKEVALRRERQNAGAGHFNVAYNDC